MYTGEAENISFSFIPKAITKKRFIKLLMGMGHQRNEANKMHQECCTIYEFNVKNTYWRKRN